MPLCRRRPIPASTLASRPARPLRLRIVARQIHLWLGLSVGALFVLLGLTGSALVFYVELDRALHPEVQAPVDGVAPGWTSPAWDRALATGRARFPHPGGRWDLEVTRQPGAIPARYYYPTDAAHRASHHGAGRAMVWFAADGSRILRAQPWGAYAMSWLYRLHMDLLLGDTGMQIVGWAGVAIVLLLVSGILAWWPRGSWRKALAFKRHAVPIRRLHDLHKHTGLWSMGLLAILVVTGILLSLPVIKALVLPTAPFTVPQSTSSTGPQVSIAQALAAGHRAVPDARLSFISVPDNPADAIRLRIQVPGDPHPRFPGSNIYIDQHTAAVLAVQDIRDAGTGTTINAWVRVLHDGSVAGTATRILALILGLVPAALFTTGLLHWRHRRAAHQSKKA